MWAGFAKLILKSRLVLVVFFVAVTIFMGYTARRIQLSYAGSKILPLTDSAFVAYNDFRAKFGEDGNVMVIGIQSPKIFNLGLYNEWVKLSDGIRKVSGIKNVLSTGHLFALYKDTAAQKFQAITIPSRIIQSASGMDSVKNQILSLPFYDGLLYNSHTNATLMAVTFDQKVLNSKNRNRVIDRISSDAEAFSVKTGVKTHLSGMPFIRTATSRLVSNEFVLFLGLSILVSAIILGLFFRNFYSVLFPVIVVVMGVVWSIGTLVLFGYDITILTGLIPPLIVIIGIPNSILLLNRYRTELRRGKTKEVSIQIALERVAVTTLIANVTAAIGFGVLCFTGSELLVQFGGVAALNVMFTWFICLCLIPIIFSWLPAPKLKDAPIKIPILDRLLSATERLVTQKSNIIYIATLLLSAIAIIGVTKIKVNGFVVDDLPQSSTIQTDLRFFEKNFEGILPLEISIDTRRKNGVLNLSTLKKMEKMENMISSYPEFSRSVSLNSGIKYATQVFFNNDSSFYRLPGNMEKNFILQYVANSGKKNGNMLSSFVDKDKQIARVSFQMADIGSEKLDILLKDIRLRTDSIFNPSKYDVVFTGSSIIFSRGTDYMLRHLVESIAIAIVLISLLRLAQFKSIGIMFISLLPNIVPLLITAGIMGFFGINLKPSTILIFTIAFGLASDQTIYFLTHYQQELQYGGHSVREAISRTIKEAGISMTHIAMILFFGFGIFTASTFGGTVILGLLLSITLLVALIFNLTLLPALVLRLKKGKVV